MSANLIPITSDGGFDTSGNITASNLLVSGGIAPFGDASPAPSLSGFDSVSALNLNAIGDITSGGNLDIDGEASIGGNLSIIGNITFSGGGSITEVTSAYGNFYGNADGSNALYAGYPGGVVVPGGIASFTGDSNAYMQINAQNRNHGTQGSMEYVVTGDQGTDTTDYLDMGFASSTWDGTQDNSLGTAVNARDGYLYVQGGGGGGNLVLGTTTSGRGIKFVAGGPNSANIVVNITNNGIGAKAVYTDNYYYSNGAPLPTVSGSSSVSTTGNVTAGNVTASALIGDGGNISNIRGPNVVGAVSYASTANSVAAANVSGLGNVALLNKDGNSSNVLYGNGVFASVPATYGNSNVATFLASFGSNTITTTGNISAGNLALNGNLTVNGAPIYGVPASYAKYTRSAQQTGLSVGSVVVCNVLENSFGSDISVNASTGQVTLAANRTYRLVGMVPGWTASTGDTRPQFCWYNETAASYIGNSSEAYSPSSGAGYGAFGGPAEAILVTNATTVVSFRLLSGATNITGIGGNTDFNTTGSYPWFDIQVIGGQAPITGFTTTGNINGGNLIVAGNATATYFIGDGSQLTGLPASYGNSNVATLLASYGSNTISTTGNITAGNVVGTLANGNSNVAITANANVIISTTGNLGVMDIGADGRVRMLTGPKVIGGNIVAGDGYIQFTTSGLTTFSGNVQLLGGGYIKGPAGVNVIQLNSPENGSARINGNLAVGASNTGAVYAGTISVSGNANIGNIGTAGLITATGNVTGGNLTTGGVVTATGNISTSGTFVGNGAGLTNVTVAQAGNIVGSGSNVSLVAGSYSYLFDNTGNFTMPANSDIVFAANTTLTSGVGTNGNITVNPDGTGQFIVTNITPAYFGNTVTIVGNLTVGNSSASSFNQLASNVQQAPTSNNFIANAHTALNGAGGNWLTFGQYPSGGTVNGQSVSYGQWLQSGYPAASGQVYYPIVLNPQGGNIVAGGNIIAQGGGVINKSSASNLALNTALSLDNISVQIKTNGGGVWMFVNTVTGTSNWSYALTYQIGAGVDTTARGMSNVWNPATTTPTVLGSASYSFGTAGSTLTFIVTDITASKMYRVTWMTTTSVSPFGNFVTIERL